MSCQPSRTIRVNQWLKIDQFCQLCGSHTDSRHGLCSDCQAELPWLQGHCLQCALPLPSSGQYCAACLRSPPPFSQVQAAWRYAFPVDSLITRFKHQAQWNYGRLLAEQLAEHLQHAFNEGLPRPQWLLPVPLSRQRQRQRGFNQAQMLAQWLGQHLHLAVNSQCLQRIRDTPAQQGLDAHTRRRNLRQAFRVQQSSLLAGRPVALVDDVLTTGATATCLARLLLQAGASRVDVYCLARTPRPQD